MSEAGVVDRLLEIHIEDQEVEQDLHLALRLTRAAHHSEAEPGRLAPALGPGDEAGNQGVEGTLPWRHRVRQALGEGEPRPPILQGETRPGDDHTRSELLKVAVDERDHVAVLV